MKVRWGGCVCMNVGLDIKHSILMKTLYLIPVVLVLCLVTLFAAEKPPVPKGVRNAGVEEFDKLRAGKNVVVLARCLGGGALRHGRAPIVPR